MNRIENLLEGLRLHRGTLFPIVARLRAMVLASGPAMAEEVKYGGILFASRTGFCGVFAYANHVTLEADSLQHFDLVLRRTAQIAGVKTTETSLMLTERRHVR